MPIPAVEVEARAARGGIGSSPSQVLFGDLHVHTTYSMDAFAMNLPLLGGEGGHPPADACDFARYCAQIDFFSINDHAEGITPEHWRETKESMRHCNAVAGAPENPDLVAFVGWEWTQVGDTPTAHFGHKNVVLRDLEDERLPTRPISAVRPEFRSMGMPWYARLLLPLADFSNRQRYYDFFHFLDEIADVPYCREGVDVRDLPSDCHEYARNPAELFEKLDQWALPSLVIPHGTTRGTSTPASSDLRRQLSAGQHDPNRQRLFEVYSGHGNAEEYRDWRAIEVGVGGGERCPAPTADYEPCCWRAGEIIRSRCEDPSSNECEARVGAARQNFIDAGVAGYHTVPGATTADWLDCGQCRDCFLPAFDYRPKMSAQHALAITEADPGGTEHRFRFGLIGSSDTHTARAGNGYKEVERHKMADVRTPPKHLLGGYGDPNPESVRVSIADVPIQGRRNTERGVSFMTTGGLVAVHARGRDREAIWRALEDRNVYGTSGPRILLWFDMLNGADGVAGMGAEAQATGEAPRFRARAIGAFKQAPGCPGFVREALSPARLAKLCAGECYHPTDERHLIQAIEVVRIRAQRGDRPPVIEDPWRRFDCAPSLDGCSIEFEDTGFGSNDTETIYYVRALQEPTPAINGDGLRCERDGAGTCLSVAPCYADDRVPQSDDCLASVAERAWSSPIFVKPPAGGSS